MTTTGFDTSGASLIVVGVSYYYGPGGQDPTITDSKVGNSWTPLTLRFTSFSCAHQFFYCLNPAVGASHTFTSTAIGLFQTVKVVAFSGDSPSFDSQTGTAVVGTTTMSADLSPTTYGFSVSGGAFMSNTGFAVAAGGNSDVTQYSGGDHVAGGLAYDGSSAGFTYAPVWTWDATGDGAMSNAQFTFLQNLPAMGGRFHRIVTRPAAFRPGIAR